MLHQAMSSLHSQLPNHTKCVEHKLILRVVEALAEEVCQQKKPEWETDR